jgi:hypothetical protein
MPGIIINCWYIDVDTLSTLPRLTLLLIPLSPCVVRDRGRRSLSGYEPDFLLPRLRLGSPPTTLGGGGTVISYRSSAA